MTKKAELLTRVWQKWRFNAPQTHLWLIKVWFSALTFVVKIATFAKPETVIYGIIRPPLSMSTVGQNNLDWLSIASFNDTFDWTKSIKTTFSTFFEFVTLHDSYWQTINLNVTNETILTIQLDAFWNKEYTLKFENTGNWPFLIIKIPNVLNISYNTINYGTTIVNTSCTIIETKEIENLIGTLTQSNIFPKDFYDRLIDCKQVNKTRFDDVYGGNIEVLHESEILILLIDENGNYIDPSLDKVIPFENRIKENVNIDKGFLSKLIDKLR